MGVAYALGTDKRKAELAAVLDGLLQSAVWRDRILTTVIRPLAAAEEERRTLASRKAAATKVDFFTLVRGDG
jgi:alpha-D-ribose 1-methylphosphonate 5-triphosphate synthase subunit PhnG